MFIVILSLQSTPLQPTSHSHVPSPSSPSLHRPFLQPHSVNKVNQSQTQCLVYIWCPVCWMRFTYPDHSGLHISCCGRFHMQSHWNLCCTDRLRSRLSRLNKVHYRSRADHWARDMAHSAPRRILDNTCAPENKRHSMTVRLYHMRHCLRAEVTYDVSLEASRSAADGQQSFFFKHPSEHTLPLLHRFL